jgi:hypothetical protein
MICLDPFDAPGLGGYGLLYGAPGVSATLYVYDHEDAVPFPATSTVIRIVVENAL